MSLRDRVERDHERILEAEEAQRAADAEAVAAKRARMADDSGPNSAVPPAKMST
jgi:hypothetical protein